MNLDNSTSDLDFYLIYESHKNNNKSQIKKNEKINWLFSPNVDIMSRSINYNKRDKLNVKIDFACYEICRVLDEVKKYGVYNKNFPTYNYRNGISNDDGQFLIFRILSSDYLWDNNYIQSNYEKLHNTFIRINILDYYFTRAKGNYDNYLAQRKVKVRKYLYTLHEIYCMKWILKYNTMPPMNFQDLHHEFIDYNICEEIYKLFQINKGNMLDHKKSILGMEKESLNIEKDDKLNKYIENEINKINVEIRKIYTNSKLNVLIGLNENSAMCKYLKT